MCLSPSCSKSTLGGVQAVHGEFFFASTFLFRTQVVRRTYAHVAPSPPPLARAASQFLHPSFVLNVLVGDDRASLSLVAHVSSRAVPLKRGSVAFGTS